MVTTLDTLEKHIKTQKPLYGARKIIKELKIFVILFVSVYVSYSLFVNADLFVQAIWQPPQNPVSTDLFVEQQQQASSETKTINHLSPSPKSSQNNTKHISKEHYQDLQSLKSLLSDHKPLATSDFEAQEQMQTALRTKLNDYAIDFNRLPPTNRLIIPKIGVDVPLGAPDYGKPIEQLTNDDFDKELYKWVLLYPTTAAPGAGHSIIFGHTSYEFYQYNKYGTVFKDLPKLQKGDLIQSVWQGELHEYKIIDKRVIHPSKIPDLYKEFEGRNILTTVGCYPIGTVKNRIVTIAEAI